MKSKLFALLVMILSLSGIASSQTFDEPRFIRDWGKGDEDYTEFFYKISGQIAAISFNYPKARLIVKICSKNDPQTALVNAMFNPVLSLDSLRSWDNVFPDIVYVAINQQCVFRKKTTLHEFWAVPDNRDFDFGTLIPANKINVQRLSVNEYNKLSDDDEFAENVKKFNAALKTNQNIKGFIQTESNIVSKRRARQVLRNIKRENVVAQQVRIVENPISDYKYPDLITVEFSR